MGSSASLLSRVFLPGVLLAFAIPAGVFFACALLADLSLADALGETQTQYTTKRQHLWGVGVLGVLPVLLLVLVGWLAGKKLEPQRTRLIALSGLLGIALVLLWVNMQYWPGYLPERAFKGFPHGLEFVIGPIFFAPVAMVVFMGVAWVASRK